MAGAWPVAVLLACLLTSLSTRGGTALASPLTAPAPSTRIPDPGYVWMPELSPAGPVVIVVSLPEQMAVVYRNGVRIAVANISSGRPGFETPTGVYSILQKHREHYSNLYENAPMPFMQRLTWDGLALHAGRVPGYAASHGCIRLPYAFAEKLFALTNAGMTVVVADAGAVPDIAYPGLFAPVDARTGLPRPALPLARDAQWTWSPEPAGSGPLTLVLSTRDRELVAMRNGAEIGRAAVQIDPSFATQAQAWGTQVYVLLEGRGTGMSALVPDRPARRWLSVSTSGTPAQPGDVLREAVASGRMSVPVPFARAVYDALVPGSTLVVTDDPTRAGPVPPTPDLLQADRAADPTRARPH